NPDRRALGPAQNRSFRSSKIKGMNASRRITTPQIIWSELLAGHALPLLTLLKADRDLPLYRASSPKPLQEQWKIRSGLPALVCRGFISSAPFLRTPLGTFCSVSLLDRRPPVGLRATPVPFVRGKPPQRRLRSFHAHAGSVT